jgi:hypothetical protein
MAAVAASTLTREMPRGYGGLKWVTRGPDTPVPVRVVGIEDKIRGRVVVGEGLDVVVVKPSSWLHAINIRSRSPTPTLEGFLQEDGTTTLMMRSSYVRGGKNGTSPSRRFMHTTVF